VSLKQRFHPLAKARISAAGVIEEPLSSLAGIESKCLVEKGFFVGTGRIHLHGGLFATPIMRLSPTKGITL